jgi:hypothetical protein
LPEIQHDYAVMLYWDRTTTLRIKHLAGIFRNGPKFAHIPTDRLSIH